MNVVRYRDLCIIEIVIPFDQNFGHGLMLIDDIVRPHRAQIINDILRDNGIEGMIWSSNMNVRSTCGAE